MCPKRTAWGKKEWGYIEGVFTYFHIKGTTSIKSEYSRLGVGLSIKLSIRFIDPGMATITTLI